MKTSSIDNFNIQQQARQYLAEGEYERAVYLYEQAINSEPEVKCYYWYLGLMLLLQGKEVEAQTTWLLAMADGEAEEVELWTTELLEVLQTEAERQEGLPNDLISWTIRQHIREICPHDINNLLNLIKLSIKLEVCSAEELDHFGILELLSSKNIVVLNHQLLMQVLETLLSYAPLNPRSLEFADVCVNHVKDSKVFINILLLAAYKIASIKARPDIAAKLVEVSLGLEPEHLESLYDLAIYYQEVGEYSKSIETAENYLKFSENTYEKVFGNYLILRGWMNACGYLEETHLALKNHESSLLFLTKSTVENLNEPTTIRLFSTTFFFPYARDLPKTNGYIRNQIARVCQKNIENYAKDYLVKYRQRRMTLRANRDSSKPLRIGYLSHCLRTHSVGWLARWLFEYHDRKKFNTYGYLINAIDRKDDSLQDWYTNKLNVSCLFAAGTGGIDIAERIYEDKIDILVDLDSITLDVTPAVMALKAAPVQLTWLGWDSAGVPDINYFIADPYVLPENAQDYYSETIWRLPQTYIAVDGFEVGVPNLHRHELNVPTDAVVYLSSQRGFKYNPEIARLQIKILKEVPGSYFLIKGMIQQQLVQDFFYQLAEEEGLNKDRIIFLSRVASSAIHRANLQIADVVLDTYPYNGATTTMETLWMCIPMVTRVGQQFAARNSYTMMMNAGITEGIAWTDEEYLEWGIRLGKDEKLRQEISWKLRKSKQTAPLWNGKQFAREMEKAYEGMWQRYMDG